MQPATLPTEMNVLLVSPDPGLRVSIGGRLRNLVGDGLHLEEAGTVADAHAKGRVFRFDVVVACWRRGRDREALTELCGGYPGDCPPVLEFGGGAPVAGEDARGACRASLPIEALTSDALQETLCGLLSAPRAAYGEPDRPRLSDSDAALAAAFEGIGGAIAIAGEGGVLLWLNGAAARLLGRDAAELTGLPAPFPVLPGTARRRIAANGGTAPRHLEYRALSMRWRGEPALLLLLEEGLAPAPAADSPGLLGEVVRQTDDSVLVMDLQGNALYANRAFEQSSGSAWPELQGQNLRLMWGRDPGNPDFDDLWRSLCSGHVWHGRFRNRRKDGSVRVEEATMFPIRDASGCISHVAAVLRDVTDRVRIEEALRHSEERYALAARGAHDGLWDWNLETGEFYMAPRWKEMLGYQNTPLEPSIAEWHDRVHPDDLPHVQSGLTGHLLGNTTHFQCEHRICHADGAYRWILARGVATREASGRAIRVAGSMTDITDRKLSEEQLLHQAWHDSLTNLINRATFIDRLRQRLTRARWGNAWNFAVLFVDLDRFKAVNDSLGHLAGDELLVQLAERMRRAVAESDTVGRIGGDEFAVLVDRFASHEEPVRLARELLRVLERPYELHGRQFHLSASIGIAFAEAHYQDAEQLLRDADTAMYRSKKHGRGSFLVFEHPMLEEVIKSVEMEIDLHNALEYDQLRVFYQPIVAAETGRIAGFEVLVRWDHPTLGFVQPGDFIPIAEESGLIIPIDMWVLKAGCSQVRAWQERFAAVSPHTFFLSANLSVRHFAGDSFQNISAALAESGLLPSSLKLEITESLLLDQTETALPLLHQLHDLGVQISLDDFGKGYSSLSYLHQFPVNTIKIDKSFVREMTASERSASIVRTIVILAHNLELPVVAEGVENRQQYEALCALGCQYAQGFLFSPPVPPPEIERMLVEQMRW